MMNLLAIGVLSFGLVQGTESGRAALVLQCEGNIGIRFAKSESSAAQATPMRMLPPGSILSLPSQTSAKILCVGNSLLDIKGPDDWQADEAKCQAGRPLDKALYQSLMAAASPVSVTRSGDGAALKTRAPKPDSTLWMLSPRGAVRQDRPQAVWSAPRNASYFQWTLSAGTTILASKAAKAAPLCRAVGMERSLCSMDYPPFADPLTAGRLMDFKVTLVGADLKPTATEDQTSFLLAAPEAVQSLDDHLARLEEAPLASRSACLARSRLLESQGVLGEAIVSLLECPDQTDPPLFDRPLARLYVTSDLARAALPHLEKLAGQASTPCERAEVDLGLGRASMLLGEHRRAEGLLRASLHALEECGVEASHGRKWLDDNQKYLN